VTAGQTLMRDEERGDDRRPARQGPSGAPVLSVRDLSVQVATPSGALTVLDGLSFDLHRGKTLCLAGESGSGKSMTALAVMGLLPKPMARVSGGSIRLGETELTRLDARGWRKVRAASIAMIFQEPMTSLNPLMTVGAQLAEAMLEHRVCTRAEARGRALKLLREVRLTEPERRLDQYPHELSGGMRQRVMIAMALACDPEVLIADEPTTALDVTVQAEILDLIRDLQSRTGAAVLMITHDMGVVAEMADDVVVLRAGRLVEAAPVGPLFAAPRTDYARALLDAVPRLGSAPARQPVPVTTEVRALDVEALSVRYPVRGGLLNRVVGAVEAVRGVSFRIAQGETLGLVGESGCGKSTTGKALVGLAPFEGSARVCGTEIRGLTARGLKPVRRMIQMVFQDPGSSLDARRTVGDQIAEPMRVHRTAAGSALSDRVAWLLGRVGLGADAASRYPHEFSGGQRQRVCIARALALGPRVIVADECVSALDVSVQAQVLELMSEIQAEDGLAYLFISHDLAVVERVADRVAVMNRGVIVETGPTREVLRNPAHPYTRRLIAAAPIPDPGAHRPRVAWDAAEIEPAPLRQIAPGRWAAV
jgi:peptide/nickel transport system ATP-binding protein